MQFHQPLGGVDLIGCPKSSDGDDIYPCCHPIPHQVVGGEPEHKLCLRGEGLAPPIFSSMGLDPTMGVWVLILGDTES
jgi:hypothetical protein